MQKYTFPLNPYNVSLSLPKSFFQDEIVRVELSTQTEEISSEKEKNSPCRQIGPSKDLMLTSQKQPSVKSNFWNIFFSNRQTERSVFKPSSRFLNDLLEAAGWAFFAALLGVAFLCACYQLIPTPQETLITPNVSYFSLPINTYTAASPVSKTYKKPKARKEISHHSEPQGDLPHTKLNNNGGKNEEKIFINS